MALYRHINFYKINTAQYSNGMRNFCRGSHKKYTNEIIWKYMQCSKKEVA